MSLSFSVIYNNMHEIERVAERIAKESALLMSK